jgi:N6-adenosine-specific RNA methylase IME4
LIAACKREHSKKPDEFYPIIEACSPGPRIERFARRRRDGWVSWGDEVGTMGLSLDALQVFALAA